MALWLIFGMLVAIFLLLLTWDGDRLDTRGLGAVLGRIIESLESIQEDLSTVRSDVDRLQTDVAAIKDTTETAEVDDLA